MSSDREGGPLAGLRVVELAGLAPVPFAGMILSDLGADVVRVDRPPSAAATSGALPAFPQEGPLRRGRHLLELDLKDPDGVMALLDLADRADVLIEGYRPGVAERLGFGPEVVLGRNPALVYARLTGWGQDGPLARTAGHDLSFVALSGALGAIGPAGQPPVPPGNYVADFGGGGMLCAVGILAALFERAGSGRGQVVDAAMVDGAALQTSFVLSLWAEGLWGEARGANVLDGGAPFYRCYATADGAYLAVAALEPAFYAALVHGLGLAEEELPPQFDRRGWGHLQARFAEVIGARNLTEWEAVFEGTNACVTPVLAPWTAAEHPHHRARQAFVEVDGLTQPAPAPRFDRTPAPVPVAPSTTRTLAGVLAEWGTPTSYRLPAPGR